MIPEKINHRTLFIHGNCPPFLLEKATEIYLRTNEEGEEYSESELRCPTCGWYHYSTTWGEWEFKKDAIKQMLEEIEEINKESNKKKKDLLDDMDAFNHFSR